MSAQLSLFPTGAAIDRAGQLTFYGQSATALAQQFGTPLYLYDTATIQQQIETYRQAMARYPGPSQLTYASKAFLCPALAKLFATAGVGLDVASAGEIFVARHGGAAPAQMHLHGNNKSPLDLQTALEAGVGRIVVDNATELARLAELAAARGQSVRIWLRVTPNVAVETHHQFTVTGTADSKFGFPLAEVEATAARLLAQPSSPLKLTGLHMHLGSHFHEAGPVAMAMGKLLDIALSLRQKYQWEMTELCPGGGWGVPYHPADPPMPIIPFVTSLAESIETECLRRNLPLPTLVLEPGRSLVAQAGVALYTVGSRKVITGVRTYVSIDGGLADNPRPALYQARYTALLANKAHQPPQETVAVAGPYCESGDVLIAAAELPVAEPGDIVAVPVAGAYQLSMGSNYNAALRPAVVFIGPEGARLVQRRETFEDLIRREV